VAAHLRQLILRGDILPGAVLAGSRKIAEELGCSRTVILEAFELLYAEGYLKAASRGSVRVATDLPETTARMYEKPLEIALSGSTRWAALTGDTYEMDPQSIFSPGAPDVAEFPFEQWSRLSRRVWRRPGLALTLEGSPFGYLPLREEIVSFLRTVRGLICRVDEVVVTSGSSSALDLCGRLLIESGDEVLVEEPGFVEARWALKAAGARLVPVRVDSEGMCIEEGLRKAPNARLAVVTPSHQYPLGVVLSARRRLALLDWAKTRNGWIIEDDYNSELRRHGNMVASLKSLDDAGRVIYLGTFSKLLFPSLRIGYLVASRPFVETFVRGRSRIDVHTPMMPQPVLAEFLRDGSLLRHLRKMRQTYAERQDAMIHALDTIMPLDLVAEPSPVGLHMIAEFTPALARRMSDREASERSRTTGNYAQPLSQNYIGEPDRQGLVFGYTRVKTDDAARLVTQLHAALAKP
ncbi:PLP-dependent aminotransferase family protein, partial [Rhizobiaceae sp. 2RAB30]